MVPIVRAIRDLRATGAVSGDHANAIVGSIRAGVTALRGEVRDNCGCPAARAAGKEADMFRAEDAFSSFAVPDIDAARRFYGETLGLEVTDSSEAGLLELHVGGGAPVLLYPKPDHRPAVFTVLNFAVPDIDAAVRQLNAAGVELERYDLGGGGAEPDDRGIYRGQGPAIGWFTDPAGNIISVLERPSS
jgi:catechol 2,3-dioxygenase-like lactoylglutathione lyase family enzyme